MCGETDLFGAAHAQLQDLQGLALVQVTAIGTASMGIGRDHLLQEEHGNRYRRRCGLRKHRYLNYAAMHALSHVSVAAAAMTAEIRRVIEPCHTKKWHDGSEKMTRSVCMPLRTAQSLPPTIDLHDW